MNWRAAIKAHAAADLLPMVPDVELGELAKDIEENGLRSPLSLWRSLPGAEWQLLDGRNRVAAMARLRDGEDMIKGAIAAANQYEAHVDPLTFVISANIRRRHLSPEQKRELVAKVLKADPARSDRAIAAEAKVSHHTVSRVRNDLRDGGQIAHHERRVGADGVAQPARKPPSPPRPAPALPRIVPESQRPATPATDLARAGVDTAGMSQPDSQLVDDCLRRLRLAIPPLLERAPVNGLGHIAAVIERTAVAQAIPHAERVAAACAFLKALDVRPADLEGKE